MVARPAIDNTRLVGGKPRSLYGVATTWPRRQATSGARPDPVLVGDVFVTELPDGRFAACQVVADLGARVELLALDWLGASRPTAIGDVRLAPKEPRARVNAERSPPYHFERLGNAEPVARFDRPCRSFSGWSAATYSLYARQRSFPLDLPMSGRAELEIGGVVTELDVGQTWRLWLGPERRGPAFAIPVAADTPIDWSELDKLGALREVEYAGRDPGFAAFLRRRPGIVRAVWYRHGQREIDLRGANLAAFCVTASGVELHIDGVDELRLSALEAIAVREPRRGRGLRLVLPGPELAGPIDGLDELRELSARALRVADLERLCGYRRLESVELRGAPGELRSVAALAALPGLRRLSLHDFYEGELASLPIELLELDTLELHGLRRSDAAALRPRSRGVRRVEIRGVKGDAWIAANIDNPFRDWIDRDRRRGEAACAAWRRALRAVGKPGADVAAILDRFVTVMNEVDRRYGLDTVDCEEIYEAYHALVPASWDRDAADRRFDELREL